MAAILVHLPDRDMGMDLVDIGVHSQALIYE